MAYIVESDVLAFIPETELIDLTDDAGTGSVNSTILDAAIASSEALINGYLRNQHTVPLSSPGTLVKDVDVKLTKHFLYKRRRDTTGDELDEGVRNDYTDSIKILKDIANGMILIDDSESFANTGLIYQSNKSSSDKTYTSTQLDKF